MFRIAELVSDMKVRSRAVEGFYKELGADC